MNKQNKITRTRQSSRSRSRSVRGRRRLRNPRVKNARINRRIRNINRQFRAVRRRPAPRGNVTRNRRQVALLAAGVAPAPVIEAEPADPNLSAESLWQLSCCRPGRYTSPYIIDGRVRSDICTGVGQTSYSETVTPAGDDYTLILFYPQIATINATVSGLHIDPAFDPITGAVNVTTLNTVDVPYADVWGNIAGFSDKFFVHNASLDIVLRAATVTTAGSVWIGSFNFNNVRTQNITLSMLKNRGKEIDLKETTRFSLKNTVGNRELVDYAGAVTQADATIANEKICYALISANPFQNITTGANVPFVIDITTNCNYAWTPDIGVPMLAKMGYSNISNYREPSKSEQALCQTLDDVLVVYPMLVSEADTGFIKSSLITASLGKKLDTDVVKRLSLHWERDDSSRFLPHENSSHMWSDIPDDSHPDLSQLSLFLTWESARECTTTDIESLPPEVLDKYDEMDSIRNELVQMIQNHNSHDRRRARTIRKLPQRSNTRHGKTSQQYLFDEDWRSYDYVWNRLVANDLDTSLAISKIDIVPTPDKRDRSISSKALNKK